MLMIKWVFYILDTGDFFLVKYNLLYLKFSYVEVEIVVIIWHL